eukprot:5848653-Prymnesium_polylepis.1
MEMPRKLSCSSLYCVMRETACDLMRTLLVERRYRGDAMPTTDERPDAQVMPSRMIPCRGP